MCSRHTLTCYIACSRRNTWLKIDRGPAETAQVFGSSVRGQVASFVTDGYRGAARMHPPSASCGRLGTRIVVHGGGGGGGPGGALTQKLPAGARHGVKNWTQRDLFAEKMEVKKI